MPSQLETPVLFIIFNRPETTKKVFECIRGVKPKVLFIAADGPRYPLPTETARCQETREWVVQSIDWPCEVKTLFRPTNLGCGPGVSGAISWFFQHVDAGIILEDDCIPSLPFFTFCEQMLHRYALNENVMMVAGSNSFLLPAMNKSPFDYFLGLYYPIWGWASWRRAWKHYDYTLSDWQQNRIPCINTLKKRFTRNSIVNFWSDYFDRIVSGQLDTWDVQWAFTCLMRGGYSITPVANFISNVGLNGAHSNDKAGPLQFRATSKKIFTDFIPAPGTGFHYELDLLTYKTIGVVKPPLTIIKSTLRECARQVYRAVFPK